jgi:hypothetical protein
MAAIGVFEQLIDKKFKESAEESEREKSIIRRAKILIEISEALRERRFYFPFENKFHRLDDFVTNGDLDREKLKKYLSAK